jgi:hypothetical protein
MKWKKKSGFKKKIKRTQPDEYNDYERSGWTPIDYFNQYINDATIKNMVDCTNIRSVKETGKSINTTLYEIKCFIGSNMFMSTLGYPRMRMYWQKRTRVPTVSNSISRDRFLVIRKFLKVVNDDDISFY